MSAFPNLLKEIRLVLLVTVHLYIDVIGEIKSQIKQGQYCRHYIASCAYIYISMYIYIHIHISIEIDISMYVYAYMNLNMYLDI